MSLNCFRVSTPKKKKNKSINQKLNKKLCKEKENRIQDSSNKRFTHGPVDGSIYAKVDKINFDLDTSINRPVNFNTENIYSNLNATSIDSGISSSLGEQNYQIVNNINNRLPKNLNHLNKVETNKNELIALNLNNKLNDLSQHFEPNYSDQLDKELNSLIEKLNNQKNNSMPKTSEEAELDELLSDMLHELQTFPTSSTDTINRNKTKSSCKMYDENSSKQICGGGRSFELESNQLSSPRFLKKPNYESENFSPNILNSNQATLGQPFSYGVVKASPALQRRRLHSEKTAYICESEPDNLKPKLSYQDKRSEENLISLLKEQAKTDNYNTKARSNSSIVSDGSVIAGQEDLDWLERQHLKLKNRKEGCFLKEKANKERILMQELRGAVLPKQALLNETDDDKFNQPLHIDTSNNLSPRLAYQQSRSQSANSYNNLDDSFRTVNTKKKTLQRDGQSGNNTPNRNLSPSPSIKKEPVHATNLTPTINDIRDKQVRGPSPIYDSICTPVANYKSIKSTTTPVSSTTMSSNITSQKNTIGYDDLNELIQTTSSPVYSSRPVSRQSIQTPISKSTYYNTGHLYSQSTPIRNISDLPDCNNPPLANPRWSPISGSYLKSNYPNERCTTPYFPISTTPTSNLNENNFNKETQSFEEVNNNFMKHDYNNSNQLNTLSKNNKNDDVVYPETYLKLKRQQEENDKLNDKTKNKFISADHSLNSTFTSTNLDEEQSLYLDQSQRSSFISMDNEVINTNSKFIKDSSQYWYRPNISREEAINILINKPPGSFIVRDSESFKGSFGLAIRVAHLTSDMQKKSYGKGQIDLVRHFLIEPTSKGVRIKGCLNEPVFGSLSALIYQHTTVPLALPCKLILPEIEPLDTLSIKEPYLANQLQQKQLLHSGAACNVLYLISLETESLTGPEAIKRTVSKFLDLIDKKLNINNNTENTMSRKGSIKKIKKIEKIKNKNEIKEEVQLNSNNEIELSKTDLNGTEVYFKVSSKGISLTDNTHRLFFRKHFTMQSISYCGLDPEDRKFKFNPSSVNSRFFGFVSRVSGNQLSNQCHLFADLEQPALAIVSFINKVILSVSSNNFNF